MKMKAEQIKNLIEGRKIRAANCREQWKFYKERKNSTLSFAYKERTLEEETIIEGLELLLKKEDSHRELNY